MGIEDRNGDLAWRVIDAIEQHRAAFNMGMWVYDPDADYSVESKVTLADLEDECGTTACFAGWTVALSGMSMDLEHDTAINADGAVVGSIDQVAMDLLGVEDIEVNSGLNVNFPLFYCSENSITSAVTEHFGPRPN